MSDLEDAINPPSPEEARVAAELESYDKEPVGIDLGPAYARTKAAQEQEIAARELKEVQEKPEDTAVKEGEKEESAEDTQEKAETEVRVRDAQGKFVKKEAIEEDKPEKSEDKLDDTKAGEVNVDKAGESKQEDGTAYEKAKKEAARKEKTWQQLEADKARVRADEARLRAERETFERLVQNRSTQGRPRDAMGNEIYTAQEYLNAAKQFRKDGEHEMADKAEIAYENAKTSEATAVQQRFADTQKAAALKVMESEPELATQDTPLAKELQSVFQEEFDRAKQNERESIFNTARDGFEIAVQVAKLRLDANKSKTLATELQAARAEIQRLNSLTTLNGSGPTKQARVKADADMTADEHLEVMDRQVREAGYNFTVPSR